MSWNRGLPRVPGSSNKPLPEATQQEIERLYRDEGLTPRMISERVLPHRHHDNGRPVRRVLRARGVPLRSHSEALQAHWRHAPKRRTGPRYG